MTKIAIIGGSGLYQLLDPKTSKEVFVDTPFGKPSDALMVGEFAGKDVVFLPRHSRNHSILPHEVNYKANIYALKSLGASSILSIGAVGSLKEDLRPRDVVVVDQFFDRTSKRPQSFFGNGFVAHVGFGDPVCPHLRKQILEASKNITDTTFHSKGTYVNMEGPQFSTRAESNYYRHFNFDVIGMTNLSEARLAREAEICYASLAFVTDYDCWREEEDDVTADAVIQVLKDNADKAREIVRASLSQIANQESSKCSCQDTLKFSMITPLEAIPKETKDSLKAILEKYL